MTSLLLAVTSILAADPTFHKDVAPILQNHCQGCHRDGEAAPMPLTTFKETRPLARAIEKAVVSRKMPPWHADPHYGKFSNDRSLSAKEIETISQWVKTGAKEGDVKDAPAPKEFVKGWTIGKPDLVLEMPVEYKVPGSGTVEYTYFLVPTGFAEDRWVEKIEVRPGAASVVHHIVMFSRPKGSTFLKGIQYGVPFVAPGNGSSGSSAKMDDTSGTWMGLAANQYEMVSVYVPGGLAYQTKPGQARLIPAGSDLIFQMHYTTNGREAVDRSRVGIVFAKEPPKERVVNAYLGNLNLRIPPGAENHRVDANATVHTDVVLQSLFPHMHLRGKAFEYEATYPSGEKQMLLKVPAYDFNWQLTYDLEKPVLLPKGTTLRATAWYDNSANNKFNPDAKAEVRWGDQSWEEMLAGFVDFVIPLQVSPREIGFPKKTEAAGPGR